MMEQHPIQAQGGGYGPPPGGFGPPPGGFGAPPGAPMGAPPGGYGPPMGAPPPGMPMAPPGGGGGGDQLKKDLDTWFIIALVTTFCCGGCLPLGAFAAYTVYQGKELNNQGNAPGATEKLGLGKKLAIANFALYFVLVIVAIIFQVVAGGMAAMN